LSPRYCLSVICMIVIGNLSLLGGEVIFFRLCCNPYATDQYRFTVVSSYPCSWEHRINLLWFLYSMQWVFGQVLIFYVVLWWCMRMSGVYITSPIWTDSDIKNIVTLLKG
jgi:hypothetical protein